MRKTRFKEEQIIRILRDAEAGHLTAAAVRRKHGISEQTFYVGDSGELVTAVHLLGIPQPTGDPLYVLLGKLWTLAQSIGSITW